MTVSKTSDTPALDAGSTDAATDVAPVDTALAPTQAELDAMDPAVGTSDSASDVAPEVTDSKPSFLERLVDDVEGLFNDRTGAQAPTMVNGVSVVGKKLNEAGDAYEHDPEALRAEDSQVSDLFDRIGGAFTNEAQRRVIEELARYLGAERHDTTSLPEGMHAEKSLASLRQDAQ